MQGNTAGLPRARSNSAEWLKLASFHRAASKTGRGKERSSHELRGGYLIDSIRNMQLSLLLPSPTANVGIPSLGSTRGIPLVRPWLLWFLVPPPSAMLPDILGHALT